MSSRIENKLFYENARWQRFVHFIFINDVNLITNNCEQIIHKALRYAANTKYYVKTNVTSVINTLLQKNEYLNYFKSNISKLKSLQDQSGKNIEDTVAEFDAPVLHSRLILWTQIFHKWKEIYRNPKSDVYNIVYNSIQLILNEEKKTVSTFALKIGLKNPNVEIYKKLANSLQCKQSDNVRNLLKQIIFEKITIRCPYERGNKKFLFLTEKAIKQYSDNWDVSYLTSSNNCKLYEPLINLLQNSEHSLSQQSQAQSTDNEFIVENEDSVATSFRNICLSQSGKRKLSDLSLIHNEISSSHKKRKLHRSTESLISITSVTNENQEEDLSEVISYSEEHSDINNNSEIRHIYSEVKTAKTIINDLSEERKNMLLQIKEFENQKNQWKEDTKQLHLELDSKIEEIKKLEEELQNEQTLRVYEELRLRAEIENVKKINSEFINKQGRMIIEINILQKELEKMRERFEKVHQEETEKTEKTSYVCSIA